MRPPMMIMILMMISVMVMVVMVMMMAMMMMMVMMMMKWMDANISSQLEDAYLAGRDSLTLDAKEGWSYFYDAVFSGCLAPRHSATTEVDPAPASNVAK